jgi:hypothetical protein
VLDDVHRGVGGRDQLVGALRAGVGAVIMRDLEAVETSRGELLGTRLLLLVLRQVALEEQE